jgi:hypothetical protein
MFDMVSGLGPKQRKYLISGDESLASWDNNHREMCLGDTEDVLANVKRMVSSKGTMQSACFSRTGFVSIGFLPKGQRSKLQFFTETVHRVLS